MRARAAIVMSFAWMLAACTGTPNAADAPPVAPAIAPSSDSNTTNDATRSSAIAPTTAGTSPSDRQTTNPPPARTPGEPVDIDAAFGSPIVLTADELADGFRLDSTPDTCGNDAIATVRLIDRQTGTSMWTREAPTPSQLVVEPRIEMIPLGDREVIVAAAVGFDGDEEGSFAIDAATGEPIWQRDLGGIGFTEVTRDVIVETRLDREFARRLAAAVDPATGLTAWTAPSGVTITPGPIVVAASAVEAAVVAHEVQTGAQLWSAPATAPDRGIFARVVDDTFVITQQWPNSVGRIDAASGDRVWTWEPHDAHDDVLAEVVAVDRQTVLVTLTDRLADPTLLTATTVVTLDLATGKEIGARSRFAFDDARRDGFNPAPELVSDIVIMANQIWPPSGDDGSSYRIGGFDRENLVLRWEVVGAQLRAAHVLGDAVLLTTDRELITVASDGSVIWRWAPSTGPPGRALVVDDTIYVGVNGESGATVAVDAGTGTETWRADATAPVFIRPVATSLGVVVVEVAEWLGCE